MKTTKTKPTIDLGMLTVSMPFCTNPSVYEPYENGERRIHIEADLGANICVDVCKYGLLVIRLSPFAPIKYERVVDDYEDRIIYKLSLILNAAFAMADYKAKMGPLFGHTPSFTKELETVFLRGVQAIKEQMGLT